MHPGLSSQHREGVRGIGRLVVYLSRQCVMTFAEVHVERSVILTDRSNFSEIPIRWLLTVDSEMAFFLFRSLAEDFLVFF